MPCSFPNFFENMAGIINISESIEVDGPEKKSGGASQQSALSRNRF
jgi:hypothetical protein